MDSRLVPMASLLPLLLLTLASAAPADVRYPGAAEVFRCTFDSVSDKNYDDWPDGWTRQHGAGFPRYVKIKIHPDPAAPGGRCLRIDLDGGGAAAHTAPLAIAPQSDYVVEAYLKTENLRHDRTFLAITFLDRDRRRLSSHRSERILETKGWKKVCLGPVEPESRAAFAVLQFHLEPQDGEPDLHGAASAADLWLGRVPRLTLASNHPLNLFTSGAGIPPAARIAQAAAPNPPAEITCTASGILDPSPEITLVLEDVAGQELARLRQPLTLTPTAPGSGAPPAEAAGQETWKPALPGPGHYRVRVAMATGARLLRQTQQALTVIEPRPAPHGSEFGWTFPAGRGHVPPAQFCDLLQQAGIGWVKYPLWCDAKGGPNSLEDTAAIVDRLGRNGIGVVGLLSKRASAAELITPGAKSWYPSLEPTMVRLGAQVRWWQLGEDTDASLVDYTGLAEKVAEAKAALDQIGQDVCLGMGWKWSAALPVASDAKEKGTTKDAKDTKEKHTTPWAYLSLSADPPLSPQDLAARLDATRAAGVQRWVVLEALPQGDFPLEARATDLVKRMVTAKVHGAEGVFCPNPFDPRRGLLHIDGTPGELFLPWRTAALALGGGTHLGTLPLPGGSVNHVFARADEAAMVLWNDRAKEEPVCLGDGLRQIDLWGRSCGGAVPAAPRPGGVPAPHTDGTGLVRVGPVPTLLVGLSVPLVRWQLDFAVAQPRIAAVPGRAQRNSLSLKNHFAHALSGRLRLTPPDRWQLEPREVAFRLAPGQSLQQNIEVTLPLNADAGRQPIRAEFDLLADRSYRFGIQRDLVVGMGDVLVETATRLNEQGELEVRQTLVNQEKRPVNFRCELLAPDRRRAATLVMGLEPGRDTKLYRLPGGRDLLGKTLWLRAEEMDGPRVLNYRFVAE